MDAQGERRRRLTHNAVNDWGPAWSPNGRRTVFLSGMNNVYDVHSMAPGGSDRRRLTHWTWAPSAPRERK